MVSSQAPSDPDAKVIAELVRNGADPSKPHELDFFFYLPDAQACRRLAKSLVASGFRTDTFPAESDSRWCVQAWLWAPLDHARIRFITTEASTLAAELGGEFDGWGAEVVE